MLERLLDSSTTLTSDKLSHKVPVIAPQPPPISKSEALSLKGYQFIMF